MSPPAPVLLASRGAAPAAPVVVARQPIFDRSETVVGFQLLCPSAPTGDPRGATSSLIVQSLADIGLARLVGARRAYLGVTREFLLTVRPLPLPPDRVVLEVGSDIKVDDALRAVLREAVDAGFRVALDDFYPGSPAEGLLDLARIVKLDVSRLDSAELASTVTRLHGLRKTLISAGVDTRAEYYACRELGFEAFQGRFFAQPVMLTGTAAPTHRLRALSMLVQRGETTSFEQLERVIAEDPGLSHKLVRLANSAFFGVRRPIGSIHDALLQLGSIVVRRWAMLLMLASVTDRPTHLLEVGLLRARLCELVAARHPGAEADRAFTAGLFSVVAALIGTPMREMLAELPFDDRMTRALADHAGPEGAVLAGVLAYEVGDFRACSEHGVSLVDIAHAFREALDWSNDAIMAVA
jgi:EAL and modified HD-GYP domain-containing signal transduction protein